jgi:hypothetical protein
LVGVCNFHDLCRILNETESQAQASFCDWVSLA